MDTSDGLDFGSATTGPDARQRGEANEEDEDVEDDIYLALFYSCQKLGAAYYNVSDGVLHLMNDMADPGPQHKLVLSILSQLNPKHLLVNPRHAEIFGKAAKSLDRTNPGQQTASATGTTTATPSTSNQIQNMQTRTTSATQSSSGNDGGNGGETGNASYTLINESFHNINVIILPGKDFGMDAAKRRLMSQTLPGEGRNRTSEDHQLLVNSLVDPTSENMIRSAGALLKYLDKNAIGGLNLEVGDGDGCGGCGVPILAIRPYTPQDVVRVDETTLTALQIFNTLDQQSSSRAGSWNRKREGLSLYLILNKCKSVLGGKHLRYMFRCLPRDIDVIRSRQEAIEFFCHMNQIDLVKSLQTSLKQTKGIGHYLKRLTASQASVKDWKAFKNTIMHTVLIAQACHMTQAKDPHVPKLLRLISEKALMSPELVTVARFIEKVFDEDASKDASRFVVKSGVDPNLDEKKRVHNGLPDLLYELAKNEIEKLPNCMESCTMVYVPQIGYMLAVEPWEGMPSEEDVAKLEFPDLQFMFCTNGVPHFKSKGCQELDETLGDTATDICDHETSIMLELSQHIVAKSSLLLEISHLIAQLDCLLALASAAKDFGWTKPAMTEVRNELSIQDGRHPLQELCVTTFVPNSTTIDRTSGRMIIMTGPNASGKSIYLKQVGIICFLAHLGSFVPAEFAEIPLLDAIYSRIQTLDSISLGLSAFTVDVNQMSLALNNATERSLVLIDEFGKGTSEIDGQALLAASLEHWLLKDDFCPFVLVSTHFYVIKSLLSDLEDKINYQTFVFEELEDGSLVYLYKMRPGIGVNSQANHVARKAGLDEGIIDRSRVVLECVAKGESLPMVFDQVKAEDGRELDFDKLNEIAEDFLNIDLDEEGGVGAMKEFIEQLKAMDLGL